MPRRKVLPRVAEQLIAFIWFRRFSENDAQRTQSCSLSDEAISIDFLGLYKVPKFPVPTKSQRLLRVGYRGRTRSERATCIESRAPQDNRFVEPERELTQASPIKEREKWPHSSTTLSKTPTFAHASVTWRCARTSTAIAPIRCKGTARANHDHRWVARKSKLHANPAVRQLPCCSFPLYIGRQNHPAPLLHLVGDQSSKVVGRPGESRAAQIGKLRLEFRNGDTDVDFPVQFFDDFCRRVLWTANAVPRTCLVPGQGFAQSWNVRQYWRARLRRYRKGAEIAGSDIFER